MTHEPVRVGPSLRSLIPRHPDSGDVRDVLDAVGGRDFLVLLVVAVVDLRGQLAHSLGEFAASVVGPPVDAVVGAIAISAASTEAASESGILLKQTFCLRNSIIVLQCNQSTK